MGQHPYITTNAIENLINDIHMFRSNMNVITCTMCIYVVTKYTLRNLCFHYISHIMGYDRGDSFPCNVKGNGNIVLSEWPEIHFNFPQNGLRE